MATKRKPNPIRKTVGKGGNYRPTKSGAGMTVKMKNGGFIAKGCGKVMNNRRKVTTIS